MKTSSKGIALITQFEGFRGTAYLCPAGVWTIGYGFTKGVKQGDTMTRAQADARLTRELNEYELAVMEATGGDCTQGQFDALVSFAFNVGCKGMKGSSVIKAHRRGDFDAASRAFGLWNKAAGKVLTGLTRRRAAEAAMYLELDEGEGERPMPQKVDGESKLSASPIITSSTITAGTATVGVVAEASRGVKDIRDSLGDWLPWALIAVAIGAGGYAIWSRVKQRRGGWA